MIRVIDLILGMPKRAARESGEKETDPQQYFIKWIIWGGGEELIHVSKCLVYS